MRVLRVALSRGSGATVVGLMLLCAAAVGPAASPLRADRDPNRAGDGTTRAQRAGSAHPAPQPAVVPREKWLKGAKHRRAPVRYADPVEAAFIHHTNSPNDYDCADVPGIIREVYAAQAGGRHWDDIGYNFLVDRCGTVYEGRAGGTGRAVVGAHAQGFNHHTVGIAAIGVFTAGVPVPKPMTDAIAAVVAWKLGMSDVDPRSMVRLVSSNSLSRFPKGTSARLHAVSGHSDGYSTQCPGAALAAELPAIRKAAARLQGR
ncbi:N-acetylmuramoyl-L-alanine amidase [Streptomyces agglomeratus]|uniref:N-acetylmuramoyl-L-alanine amidase n=1 Tax=Streptomyces agglomeratus TaxID=285458 RepID=A0A1E5P3T6_9ACTN|nr:peptidoglycan recognition protein [Streptomyces agglomeratus]OEJ24147.1 N-acetylmuramoyl-L-alanine amidase [Streptomyces agglomeratus]OEJ41850.1 N-acetylmuramoyl-L-alanine amidase [Streptomyces agglomeratus]OEJ43773.1 N-acetylmuramoyl-L-alanine amidase [Streptomyces agglomeratus]OEJ54342.1 N-acetylmuramoyl-L-alanine amidase [Streptomyces agglomeratus]